MNFLWTDECLFSEVGAISTHNDHYWSNTNPYFVHEIHHQRKFSDSVWCGIWNGKLIGPVFYDRTLSGLKYVQLILNCSYRFNGNDFIIIPKKYLSSK